MKTCKYVYHAVAPDFNNDLNQCLNSIEKLYLEIFLTVESSSDHLKSISIPLLYSGKRIFLVLVAKVISNILKQIMVYQKTFVVI